MAQYRQQKYMPVEDSHNPFKKVSKQAIAEFERQYLEACKKYYAEQDK